MARDFNGTTGYASNATTPVTAIPLTLAAWFKTDDDTRQQSILTIGDTASTVEEFDLACDGSAVGDPVQANTRHTTTSTATTSSGFTAGVWAHACAVFTSATSRAAFINGSSKGTNATSKTPTSLDTIRIGALARSAPDNFFDGSIADAAIWSASLTDAEVAALARGVSPLRIRPLSLVFYAPLLGLGSPEPDYTSGQRVLTLTGSPAAATAPIWRQPPFSFDLTAPSPPNAAAPSFSQINTPCSYGSTAGGYTRNFSGSDFRPGCTVDFGGTPATSVVFVSSASLTVTVPAHALGTVSATVTNPDGQTASQNFIYAAAPTVSSATPSSAPTAGGDLITIAGTGFRTSMTITFKGVTATSPGISSSISAFGTTAASSAGTGDVVATNEDGQSGTLTNGFTYGSGSTGHTNRMLMGIG